VLAESIDFAILDVNINGHAVSPVADLIEARNRPFFFASGYGVAGLPEKYRQYLALKKPFQIEKLAQTIDRTLRIGAG
jgi:hypothetical protein